MKVLIVAESEKILEQYSSFFKTRNYDVLKYRWLMKALDNLEEIEPEICVISASDYPRHWKTFIQFLHATITKTDTKNILITGENFSDEEKEKAKVLGIKIIIDENTIPENSPLLKEFDSSSRTEETEINNESTSQKTINTSEESVSLNNTDLIKNDFLTENTDTKFIFTMPHSNQIINGTVVNFDYPMIYFSPADYELKNKFKIGQLIESCTLKTGSFTESLRGQIRAISDTLEICLLK